MWKPLLLLLLCTPAYADTITFDVPESMRVPNLLPLPVQLFSSALNGTVLSGQDLSLDVGLQDDFFARVLIQEARPLSLLLVFDTTGVPPDFPGFATNRSGHMVLRGGEQIDLRLGGASGGTFGQVALVLRLDNPGPIIDVAGGHFEFTLPATGYAITNTRLSFVSTGGAYLATPATIPEPSSLVLLVVSGIAGGVGYPIWRSWSRRKSLARSRTIAFRSVKSTLLDDSICSR